MTPIEKYDALPNEIQLLIEEYAMNFEFAEECFQSMLSLCPKKECSISALAEAYADWKHHHLIAKEKLQEKGIDNDTAYMLGFGYWEKYHTRNKDNY